MVADEIDGLIGQIAQTQETDALSTQQLTQDCLYFASPDDSIWGFLVPALKSSKLQHESFRLPKKEYTIGRADSNDIVVLDRKISNVHCIVTLCDDEETGGARSKDRHGDELLWPIVLIKDLSTNGTYVNGQRVKKETNVLLAQGDQIVLGRLDEPSVNYIFNVPKRSRRESQGENGGGLYDSYALGQVLGAGSFGQVRLCVDKTTGLRRACKIIKRGYLRSAGGLQIAREVDILEQLDHVGLSSSKGTAVDFFSRISSGCSIFIRTRSTPTL